jgi:ribokinase
VDSASIREAEADLRRFVGQGIALAMPEVPLAARAELLALGTRYRLLRVASFTSEEMAQVRHLGILAHVDLLAINLDEAVALSGEELGWFNLAEGEIATAIERMLASLRQLQPSMMVSITAGRHGSWTWDGKVVIHVPAHKVKAVGTAGAGDAHLAGILTGLAAGLSLGEAHEFGALTAALSVTSPHTINKDIDRRSLNALAEMLDRRRSPPVCAGVRRLLGSQGNTKEVEDEDH